MTPNDGEVVPQYQTVASRASQRHHPIISVTPSLHHVSWTAYHVEQRGMGRMDTDPLMCAYEIVGI